MRTVGVAPGTITLQLGNACPPDPPWQYMTPPTFTPAAGPIRPSASAGPRPIAFEPYGTESYLMGIGDDLLPPRNPYPTRWDIIGMVGGGALLVALTLGFIATR